jgi:hypothetical protein
MLRRTDKRQSAPDRLGHALGHWVTRLLSHQDASPCDRIEFV